MLKEACDIPDNDSLKISQSLERIFLQNCSLFRCEKPAKRAKKASNAVKKARDLLKEAFDITNDDSLKLSRNLELIFLQNCAVPPAPEVELNEVIILDEVGPDDVEDKTEDDELTEEITDFLCNA